MAQYKNYVIVQTLDEAYALNAKKSTVIVAGNMWLRMCGMRREAAGAGGGTTDCGRGLAHLGLGQRCRKHHARR